MITTIIHSTLLICAIATTVCSYEMLFLPASLTLTHKRSMLPIAQSVGARGNKVIFWTVDIMDSNLHSVNITEERVVQVYVTDPSLLSIMFQNDTKVPNWIWTVKRSSPFGQLIPWRMSTHTCYKLVVEQIEELERVAKEHWDLIIIDAIFSPCAYLIAKVSETPVVIFGTTFPYFSTANAKNIPQPPSYYPSLYVSSKGFKPTTFQDRMFNAINYILQYGSHRMIEMLIRSTLNGHFEHFTFHQFEGNALLSTSVFPLEFDYAKPITPDLFSTYTVCPTPKPLPTDLLEFVNDPQSKGTIIMAFGHAISWSGALPTQLKAMESALDNLTDFRIIWQCDVVDTRPQQSRMHIRRLKWLPQTDLLFHEKTKVFITHAGLKSITEALCADVPFVVMPQFAEQFRSSALIVQRGLGLFLDKFSLTGELISSTILEVINNPKYKRNSRQLGAMIRDKPIPAHNYAAFTLEFAARHKHRLRLLHNRGAKLNFFHYYNHDVVIGVAAFVSITLFLVCLLLIFLDYSYNRQKEKNE